MGAESGNARQSNGCVGEANDFRGRRIRCVRSHIAAALERAAGERGWDDGTRLSREEERVYDRADQHKPRVLGRMEPLKWMSDR